MTKYIIISDIHLGSEVCQRDKVIHFLKHLKTETLIINGDLIDINHTKRLKKKDWEILSLLRKLSKEIKIIYLPGNHDSDVSQLISELLGFDFKTNYQFELNGKKFCVIHGDSFDFFISKFWLLTEIATGIYYYIQRFSSKKQLLARSLKRSSKGFIKCCEHIKNGALKYAKVMKYDFIICGHSHQFFFEENSPYINTGCFTSSDTECHYLEIKNDGKMRLVEA